MPPLELAGGKVKRGGKREQASREKSRQSPTHCAHSTHLSPPTSHCHQHRLPRRSNHPLYTTPCSSPSPARLNLTPLHTSQRTHSCPLDLVNPKPNLNYASSYTHIPPQGHPGRIRPPAVCIRYKHLSCQRACQLPPHSSSAVRPPRTVHIDVFASNQRLPGP